MRSRVELLAVSTALLFSLLVGCTTTRKAEDFRFLDNFDAGRMTPAVEKGSPTGKPAFIMDEFNVGGEKRRAMIVVAPAKIVFDVGQVKGQSKLKFSVGMNATMGDGAEGIITVEAGGQTEIVYRRLLDPADRPNDRRWFDESVDLSKFSGKSIKITFETGPGPKGDATADWFAWANIEVTS
jgi:hypothetical protein